MRKYIFIFIIIMFLPVFSESAPLSTKEVEKIDPDKLYSLILYGGRHYNDLETIAIFDIEGDRYIFEPFAPDFDFFVKKGLPAEEAMTNAKTFVSSHFAFRKSQLSKILDKEGNIIGYELRPIYYPLFIGDSDPIEVDYWQKDGKIKVTIRLKPEIERRILNFDGSRDFFK